MQPVGEHGHGGHSALHCASVCHYVASKGQSAHYHRLRQHSRKVVDKVVYKPEGIGGGRACAYYRYGMRGVERGVAMGI